MARKRKDTSKYREAALRRWQEPGYRERMQSKWSVGQRRRFKDPKEVKRVYELGIKKWQKKHREEWLIQQRVNSERGRPAHSAIMKKRWTTKKWSRLYLGVIGNNVQPEWVDRKQRAWRFKSTWELAFAQWLDMHVLTWSYEPATFTLADGRHYWPDFWVEQWGSYVEIKAGHRSPAKMWQALYEGHPILLLQGNAVRCFYRWIAQ